MKKSMHIAKANIRKQKGAAASMFIIILLVSALLTIGLTLILGVEADYVAGVDRLNGIHSLIIMPDDKYEQSFEEIIRDDLRVLEYDIGEVVYANSLKVDYGGEFKTSFMILNADYVWKISAPEMVHGDDSVPRDRAIYLPTFARSLGYNAGSPFTLTYRNKPISLIVAGFFETSESATPNEIALKVFAADECYEALKREIGSSAWISVRFHDRHDSTEFNEDFKSKIDVPLSLFAEDSTVVDSATISLGILTPTSILSVIMLLFAIIIVVISLLVTRFRITNSIEDAMHTIGVLKASGYKSGQIIKSYLLEYGMIALPAAFLGLLIAIPAFSVIRQAMAGMTGFGWTLAANIPAGVLAAILTMAALLLMVLRSSRKIRKLPPVDALRGGIAVNSRRRNSFPLHKGVGNVHTRLGLKGSRAYLRQYVMIGVVLAAAAFAIIMVVALYQNFVLDGTALLRMTGVELSDAELRLSRDTDADALAADLERHPEVRKTGMLDWSGFEIEGYDTITYVTHDYGLMESMEAHEGRLPKYDNEAAITKLFADRLGGKVLGDSITVKANGVTREFIICGYISGSNGIAGQIGAVTLDGYRRFDPDYRRSSILVYFNDGVTFDEFDELLKSNYGVNYEEVSEYGDGTISSGLDNVYHIESVVDMVEWGEMLVGTYGDIVQLLTQVVSLISLGIIALILIMTVRQIVTRRRRELGILKSGGFTTRQLARQLAISFLPCSILGALVGCVFGAFMVNPAITAMFASSGVYNANVSISPAATAMIGALALLFTFAVANMSAMRIKHITVYELLSE